jgi:hypothetical protein
VLGLVEDGKYKNLTETPQLAMFLPVQQSPVTSTMYLIVRSNRDPDLLSVDLRKAFRDLDRRPDRPRPCHQATPRGSGRSACRARESAS